MLSSGRSEPDREKVLHTTVTVTTVGYLYSVSMLEKPVVSDQRLMWDRSNPVSEHFDREFLEALPDGSFFPM